MNAADARPRLGRRFDVLAWIGFAGVAAFFLMLKSFCLHWQVSDENIYYYMANTILTRGALPYRDFFFAHPPLHLVPGIATFALLGFGPLTARLMPVSATLVAAVFLFLLAKSQLGRLAAITAVSLYLTSFEVLGDSTHWTGVNCAVMWLVIGWWALLRRRAATAGALFALGVCTGNYILPAAAMAGALAVLESRAAGTRYLVGFAVPWLLVQGAGLLIGGQRYLESVYLFHFAKPAVAGASASLFYQTLTDNFGLFLGTAFGLVLAEMDYVLDRSAGDSVAAAAPAGGRRGPARLWARLREDLLADGARSSARVGALFTFGYLLFIAMLPAVFSFYFLPMFPGMAVTSGYAIERCVHYTVKLIRTAGRRDREWWEGARVVGMVVFAAWAGYMLRVPLQRSLVPSYVRSRDTPMQWADSPLPINSLLRRCCWDDVAQAYTLYGTVQETLYHESRYFEAAEALSEYVRQNSRPDQTLFGDSSTAGLVALLAERQLAADFADTNLMRFSSDIIAPEQAIEQIDTPRLAFVLVQGRAARDANGTETVRYGAVASLPGFHRWLDEYFEPAFRVDDRTKGTFLLFKRRPPPAG